MSIDPPRSSSLEVGTLDRAVRRMNRLAEIGTALRLLPTVDRMLQRPPEKRKGPKLPARIAGPMPAGISIQEREIDGPGGRLPVRIYRREGQAGTRPGLIYLHGGGWVALGARTTDRLSAELAARADVRIVSVDYRLAPETPFPGPLDDAAAGLRWTVDHAAELGIDPTALGVAGDSAGGNLAAALAIRSRDDEDLPTLRFQALLYPVLDGTLSTPSMLSYDGPGLSPDDMRLYYDAYGSQHDREHPLLSPLYVCSAAGLPAAVVVTAGFDPLRDEGRLYADRLRQAGVPSEHAHYPNAPHGFLSLAALCSSAEPAITAIADAMRSALHPSTGKVV